jgi:hypothetical protein
MRQWVVLATLLVVSAATKRGKGGGGKSTWDGEAALRVLRTELEPQIGDAFKRLSPAELFEAGTDACSKGDKAACFVLFDHFSQQHPGFLEGFSNVGVALEQMDKLREAAFVYRRTIRKFPEDARPKTALANVLQRQVVKFYDKGKLAQARTLYKEMVVLVGGWCGACSLV